MSDEFQPLTPRQEEVLEYIYDCVRDGLPPTRAEIAAKFSTRTSTADECVRSLARKKRIELVPGIARGIKVEL